MCTALACLQLTLRTDHLPTDIGIDIVALAQQAANGTNMEGCQTDAAGARLRLEPSWHSAQRPKLDPALQEYLQSHQHAWYGGAT